MNSLLVGVYYYALKKNLKTYEPEIPPTTFYIFEKMNGLIIDHVRP
jgi:hypothetical protein